MVNYFIYAKDFSGSTRGDKYFHENGIKTLNDFKRDIEKIQNELRAAGVPPTESKVIYLHWGDHCFEVDEEISVLAYKELASGNMCTVPATIIDWLKQNCDITNKNNQIKLLYIITDGLIDTRSTQECFNLNEDMHYESVVFHGINKDPNQINLSVAASFFKKHCAVFKNYNLYDNINISEPYNYDKINIDNFIREKNDLSSYIKLKFLKNMKENSLALKEIDKLKKLRDRLFVELSSKSKKTKIDLETKERDIFLHQFVHTDWYKNLNTTEHDAKVEIEKFISTLINYIVSDNKSYAFDALKFETKFHNPVEEEPIVDVDFAPEQEIEFPDIILDDEKGIPVILLTEFNLLDKIIFHKTKSSNDVSPASFSKFKSAMECPLFLLNDADISESIGYFYTLNVYKQLLENTTKTEPRTRRPFHGGLVITDTDEFDKYNDYILSATYFDFKKIKYNTGLFYYVLWKNCENKEWMDKNVVEQFKKYVMRRISKTVCKIGLSSLPLDPPENTSLLTALWYCVELASCLFKNDPQNFVHERMRMFYGVAHCMIEILKYFNYNLDLESIEKRRDVIRHVMILKKIPTKGEKVYYMLERIFKTINGFLVCEIEKPFNISKLNYLKLNHKDMLCDDAVNGDVDLNDYVHLMHFEDDSTESEVNDNFIKICEKTFRPFFTIDKDKSFYTELMKVTRKIVINNGANKDQVKITFEPLDSLEFDKILSLYNLFINCVKDSEKYPTLHEYADYVLKKKKYHDDLVTIFPTNVYKGIEYVHARYQDIVAKVDVKKFIDVTKSYVKRFDRVKAEEIVKFNNDNEINDFIQSQELKVNLIKRLIDT